MTEASALNCRKNNDKGGFIMKKYTIYRIYGVKDENSPKRKKELAAVEYGADFLAVTPALVKAVYADIAGMAEYDGCEIAVYEPDVAHYDREFEYKMLAAVAAPNAAENTLIHYFIQERDNDTDE